MLCRELWNWYQVRLMESQYCTDDIPDYVKQEITLYYYIGMERCIYIEIYAALPLQAPERNSNLNAAANFQMSKYKREIIRKPKTSLDLCIVLRYMHHILQLETINKCKCARKVFNSFFLAFPYERKKYEISEKVRFPGTICLTDHCSVTCTQK